MSNVPVRSVKKALDLLSILIFDDPFTQGLTLSELAAKLDLPANTAHNLLKTMAVCGFVAQTNGSRYITGPKCQDIGLLNQLNADQLKNTLNHILTQLCDRLDESIVLATLAAGRRIVPVRVNANQIIAINSDAVDKPNIYEIPTGRILFAYADNRQRDEIIAIYGWPQQHWSNITTIEELNAAAESIRNAGHCTIVPDRHDVASFACPVLKSDGQLIGALGCHAPMFRCPEQKQNQIIDALKQTATQIAAELCPLRPNLTETQYIKQNVPCVQSRVGRAHHAIE